MWQRLLISRTAQKHDKAREAPSTQKGQDVAGEPRESEQAKEGMHPLPLAFPTASWSSYHPSGLESSDSGAASMSLPSPCHSQTSQLPCETRELRESAELSRLYASSSLMGNAPRGLGRSGGWMLARLEEWCVRWNLSKPWKSLESRESRRAARSHALLYLALIDPMLSTTALLPNERTQFGFMKKCGKQDHGHESSILSLLALIGFACIILFLAFAFGVAIGCALVGSRPYRGAAAIAVVPTRGTDSEWDEHEVNNVQAFHAAANIASTMRTAGGRSAAPTGQAEALLVDRSGYVGKGTALANTPVVALLVPYAQTDANEPLAVLKGAFKLLLPHYNGSLLGGTESGVFLLEYIPAPRAGGTAEELCFTPYHTNSKAERNSKPINDAVSSSSTANPAGQLLLGPTGGGTPIRRELAEAQRAVRRNSAVETLAQPLVAGSSPTTASAELSTVERSRPLFETFENPQHLNEGFMLEVSIRNAKEALQQLPSYAGGDAVELFMNWGSYVPLHGDAILADELESTINNFEEPHHGPNPYPGLLPLALHPTVDRKHHFRPLFGISEGVLRFQPTQRPRSSTYSIGNPNDVFNGLLQGTFTPTPPKASNGLLVNGSSMPAQNASRAYPRDKNSSPQLFAASFHPIVDSQGSGFRVAEVRVTLNYRIFNRKIYEDLLQDCRLGRIHVQLSTVLAYYTLFYWKDVEYHRYLPLPLGCVLNQGAPNGSPASVSTEGVIADHQLPAMKSQPPNNA